MPQILKPVNLSLTWASGGEILNPGDSKYQTGWQVEVPPRQWFNYLDNRQDTAIAHINQHGVPVWDSATEYQADKSYVQGVTNGTIYRCVQTHANQNPETDVTNTYWIVAFASAGDFYTKAEADGAFLSKTLNGSDILNPAAFRSNLSVYSQAQTYTKGEVDAKTTVASTAQSQAWASNTTLLTPLRLSEAFKGGNQSLGTIGFQKTPGGKIEQWGFVNGVSDNATVSITFPVAMTSLYFVIGGFTSDAGTTGSDSVSVVSKSPTGVTLRVSSNNSTNNINWYVIGA
jgi:hypothetical protein